MKNNMNRSHTFLKCIIWSWFFFSVAFGQPKLLVVGGTELNFGDVPNFTPTKHRIVLKNIGTDTLILSEIGTSCGCTATLLSNDHIAPKDSANLDVTFDAERFSGETVRKRISMVTNDNTQASVGINFSANVVKVIQLEPKYFYIRTLDDSIGTGSLTITNSSERTIHITSIRSTQSIFTPSISERILKPGDSATLSVTIPPSSSGTYTGNIELTIDHSLAKQINIRCFSLVTENNHK